MSGTRRDREKFLRWAYGHGEEGDTDREEEALYISFGSPLTRANHFLKVHGLHNDPWGVRH